MGGMRQVLELGRVRKPYSEKTVLGFATLAFAAGAKVGAVMARTRSATASSPAERRR